MSCASVTNFKEHKGDCLFKVKLFPLPVRLAWQELAHIVGESTSFIIAYRRRYKLPFSVLGMGGGATLWIKYAGLLNETVLSPHPSSVRGHPGTTLSFLEAARQVRSQLALEPLSRDTSEASRILQHYGIDIDKAKDRLACILHTEPDLLNRVLRLGDGFNSYDLTIFVSQRWWTTSVLDKFEKLFVINPQVAKKSRLLPSFWAYLKKAENIEISLIDIFNVLLEYDLVHMPQSLYTTPYVHCSHASKYTFCFVLNNKCPNTWYLYPC